MSFFRKAIKPKNMLSRWIPAEDRFWERVNKTEGCWLWTGPRYKQGYGKMQVSGKTVKAHRFAFELHHGPIPPGMDVLHTCDNPPCVRPDHLYAGTDVENAEDRVISGHTPAGAKNGRAKLTERQVLEIRALWVGGDYRKCDLAAAYNVTDVLIGKILRREVWTQI